MNLEVSVSQGPLSTPHSVTANSAPYFCSFDELTDHLGGMNIIVMLRFVWYGWFQTWTGFHARATVTARSKPACGAEMVSHGSFFTPVATDIANIHNREQAKIDPRHGRNSRSRRLRTRVMSSMNYTFCEATMISSGENE
jgi:hypothetical protein